MSAIIFDKSSAILGTDRTIILAPRTAFQRRMAVTPDWKTLRIGVFASVVGLGSHDAAHVTETISVAGEHDRGFLGVRNVGVGHAIPTLDSSGQYAGYRMGAGLDTFRWYGGGSGTAVAGYIGFISGLFHSYAAWIPGPPPESGGSFDPWLTNAGSSSGSSLYAAYWGVEIVRTPGVSLRVGAVRIWVNNGRSDTGEAALITGLQSQMESSVVFTGASAVTLSSSASLDVFYVRFPTWLNRLRIHSYGYIQIA